MHWCINIIWLKTQWQLFILVASLCIKITHIIKQQCTFFLPCASLSWLSRKFPDDEKHWICSVWLATFLSENCLLEHEVKCKLFGNGTISSVVDESSVDKLKGSGSTACGRSATATLSTMKSVSLSWLSRKFSDDDKHWICSVWLETFLWEMCLIEDELKCKLFGNGSISSEVNESSFGKLKGSGGSMACGKSVTL